MKQSPTPICLLAVIAFGFFAVGCATTTQNTENLAVAAGFHPLTPGNAKQEAFLASLPANKVSPATYEGKSFYVLPDIAHNIAYIGGPKQYQAYAALRTDQQLSNENLQASKADLQAAELNEMDSMPWGMWGGWGTWGPGFW